jgi:hypothetical protein
MIQTIFDACVWILLVIARWTGLSYKAVNVIIFCVIWPLLTLGLISAVVYQHRRWKRHRRNCTLGDGDKE